MCFSFDNRKIGPRSKVWCEKEMVDAAAYEFAEVNSMIDKESFLKVLLYHVAAIHSMLSYSRHIVAFFHWSEQSRTAFNVILTIL